MTEFKFSNFDNILPDNEKEVFSHVLGQYLIPYYLVYLNCDHPFFKDIDLFSYDSRVEQGLEKIDDRIKGSLNPLLPPDDFLSTYYHELAHYLQAVMTSDGMRTLALYSRLFDLSLHLITGCIYVSNNSNNNDSSNVLKIPVKKWAKIITNDLQFENRDVVELFRHWCEVLERDIQFYQGFQIYESNVLSNSYSTKVMLTMVEVGTHQDSIESLEVPKITTILPVVEIGYVGLPTRTYILGARHLNEGAARMISNIYDTHADKQKFNDLINAECLVPDLVDYYLAFRLFHDTLKGTKHTIGEEFIVLCELSLMVSNAHISAGFAFVVFLKLLENDKSIAPFDLSNPLKFTIEVSQKAFQRFGLPLAEDIWNSILDLVNKNKENEWARNWIHLRLLTSLFLSSHKYRSDKGSIYFPVHLDLLNWLGIIDIYDRIPFPIICYNNGKLHHYKSEPIENMDAHFVYNFIEADFISQLLNNNDVICPLVYHLKNKPFLKNFCSYIMKCDKYNLCERIHDRESNKCLFWSIAYEHLDGLKIQRIEKLS